MFQLFYPSLSIFICALHLLKKNIGNLFAMRQHGVSVSTCALDLNAWQSNFTVFFKHNFTVFYWHG
jgi:hypothetical protein